jgi:hypothetical protein
MISLICFGILIILLGIIIVSFYNINRFTNNKYMGLLFLTVIILIITLLAYYIININKIVRTISSNYYGKKEFEKTYESFENQENTNSGTNSNSGTEVICDLPVLRNNRLYFNCGNTQTETSSMQQMGSGESSSGSGSESGSESGSGSGSGSGSSSGNMQQNTKSGSSNTKQNMMELLS